MGVGGWGVCGRGARGYVTALEVSLAWVRRVGRICGPGWEARRSCWRARLHPSTVARTPGLVASGHLLAAANSPDGSLEYGIEYHPPRDDFITHAFESGKLVLGDAHGLGVVLDEERLSTYRVRLG